MTIGVLLPVTSHDVEAQAPAGGQTTTFAATDVQKGARPGDQAFCTSEE